MTPRAHNSIDYDELTKLPTMMYFRHYAVQYILNAHRFGHTAYFVYFNLENFSAFNERYGLEEGDNLLRLLSVSIQYAFPGFLLSRFSDDHFLLVCESRHIERCINDIHEEVRSLGRHANLMLKAGIYTIEDATLDIGIICDRAKAACDSIAHRYDRIYRWFDDTLLNEMERNQYIESHIDRAISHNWIKVYYQPIVRAISGQVCEFEALARWDDPHYGLLSPAVFIDVLENARLIHKLDAFVIREVCREWQKQHRRGKWAVPCSINLSRTDFELCDVFEMVESAACQFEVPRYMLHIEITETALTENANLLASNIERFRSAGYQVWLDDFGSGYSSLNTLKDYVFDVVKIDMGFLKEFDSKPKSRVIIATVVNMAKQLGMQTLIEGVETPAQRSFLRDIGCEMLQGYLIGKPVPSEENVKRILSGDLAIEPAALHGYYDRLGKINSLSATPFVFPWDDDQHSRAFADTLPLAVVEREAGELRFVVANDSFVKVVKEVGIGTLDDMTSNLLNGNDGQSNIIREAIRAAVASNHIESVDILENGLHCVLRTRRISSHGNIDALLISLMNLSRYSDIEEDRRLQIAMRYMYAIYDEVNIANIAMGTLNTLYRGNALLPAIAPNTPVEAAHKSLCDGYIHPDDRKRFLSFMNLSTVDERVNKTDGRRYLAEAFRMLLSNGLYAWISIYLIPIVVEGEKTVLVCSRRVNDEILSSIHEEEVIPKSLLWDTLIDLVPAGIFWKDKDRRFLGVNKNFLDFYAFESINDVLGKNDEEMGWHVNTDPFKNNEYRVLAGDSVLNSKGTCIAQGGVRHIVASKIPLRRNGEVVGILGYFTDRTEEDEEKHRLILDGFDRMAETDQLTGIPNLRGLTSSGVSYQEAFEENGIDFEAIVLDLDGMKELNNVYGRSFGNLVLKLVSRTLTKACGVSGAMARVGGDKFAALKQIEPEDDPEVIARHLADSVTSIHEVAGINLNLRCYMGWSIYSEAGGLSKLLTTADERMHDARQHE